MHNYIALRKPANYKTKCWEIYNSIIQSVANISRILKLKTATGLQFAMNLYTAKPVQCPVDTTGVFYYSMDTFSVQ